MKIINTYWKTNLNYLVILLSIWFTVSFGFGILLADQLNQIQMGGFKLGFWFAQQGAIYVFVILIFVYIYLMNRLDQNLKTRDNGITILDLDRRRAEFYIIYCHCHHFKRASSTGGYIAGKGCFTIANGMATAADWMSAASFISMAGIISFNGYDGSVI